MKDKFEIKDTMGLGSVVVALILIWIVSDAYFSESCNTTVDACNQIMKDTAYYPIVLLMIVVGVVIGILVIFIREEKNE